MAQILDDVSYLAQEIGPRPAGTEEEQQAALYIAERLQKDAGFDAEVEDFKCMPDFALVRTVCYALALLAALVAFLFDVAAVPAIIVGLVVAVLFVLELVDKPVVTRLLSRGISQNVVARYETPRQETSSRRRRKVVLVARYDSGRSMPFLRGPILNVLPILQKGTRIAIPAIPILLLIRHVAFAQSAGVLPLLFNIVIIVGMVFMLASLAWEVLGRLQQYNDAANSNASGVAVMLEIARRIGRGRIGAGTSVDGDAVVHGEQEAREAGVVPEGAELVYETEQTVAPSPQDEAQRLAAAKAAIAAMTGTSVGSAPVADISENLAQVEQAMPEDTEEQRHEQNLEILNAFSGGAREEGSGDGAVESAEAVETHADAPAEIEPGHQAEAVAPNVAANAIEQHAQVSTDADACHYTNERSYNDDSVPDWYKKAQQRAKKQPQPQQENAFRSRYAATLDATEAKLHEQDVELQAERERQEAAARQAAYQRELDRRRAAEEAAQREKALQDARRREAELAEQTVSRETPVAAPIEASEDRIAPVQSVSRETTETVSQHESRKAESYAIETSKAEKPEAIPAAVSRETSEPKQALDMSVMTSPVKNTAEQTLGLQDEQQRASMDGGSVSVPDATTAMAPIDVSDLLEEMKSYQTTEPAVPAFITGEHEKISIPSNQDETSEHTDKADHEEDSSEQSRLIDPDAPFIPVSTDRTVQMTPVNVSSNQEPKQHRRAQVILPDLPEPDVAPIAEVTKQRAPLADVTDNKAKKAARSLLSTVLPEVGGSSSAASASNEAAKHNLVNLPSLSGELRSVHETSAASDTSEHNTVSATGSFATVGATGSFAPVGDELVADVAPDDLYVTDADDSDYAENFTETGAFAGPGYVEMPKSRVQKLLGRFGFGKKKKREEEMSAHEWLDVDEDFEAQRVGKQRGSWESFRTDDAEAEYSVDHSQGSHTGDTGDFTPTTAEYADEFAPGYADGSGYYTDSTEAYDGTATPLPANSPLRRANTFNNVSIDDSFDDSDDDDFNGTSGRWNGGAVSSDRPQRSEGSEDSPAAEGDALGQRIDEEVDQIYEFRNPDIDFDVWFVAVGSTLSNNEGMKQFIAMHEPELKHAIVINLESLGAGDLTFVNKEGSVKKRTVSSRMKRCIKKATHDTGVSCGTREIAWRESPATVSMAHRLQGMTLAGMDGLKPAGYAEQTDTVSSVREERLQANAEFVISMLKNI